MKCSDLELLIDAYAAGKSEAGANQQIEKHLAECEFCRKQVNQQKEYFLRVSNFNAPALDSSRAARILRLAVAEGQKRQQAKRLNLSFARGFVAASVLAVAVMLGVNTFQTTDNPPDIVAGLDWEREVSLVINVPKDMDGAQLILDLPADISIQGLEHLARVEWPVDLKKGSNIIDLPINIEPYAEFAEQVTLTASIVHNDKKRNFKLDINLASPQNNVHGQIFEEASVRFPYV